MVNGVRNNAPNEPAHFHVRYSGQKALIAI
jgi:hypothetical protein